MELILYPEQYTIIWRVSWLSAVSSAYALYKGQYSLAAQRAIILLNSINYWRYPDYSWRRYIDIICIYPILAYHINYGLTSKYRTQYFIINTIGLACFPIGVYYYEMNDWWKSTYYHCALHIITNIANIILSS